MQAFLNRRPSQKVASARLVREAQREEQSRSIGRELQVRAGLLSEEKTEQRRHHRRLQHEMHERDVQEALLKVHRRSLPFLRLINQSHPHPGRLADALIHSDLQQVY